MEAGITKVVTARDGYCCVSGDENEACFTAMEAEITISFTAMEAGITLSFTAMEAGITKVVFATYTVMKMTRVSLQWKRE